MNRFDVIVNNGDVYKNAADLPENHRTRDDYAAYLKECLESGGPDIDEAHFKAVGLTDQRADNFQNISVQEGAIIDYLREHDRPEKIRVICPDEDTATLYQMTYNFYYATEKGDRIGLEKWD